MTSGEENQNPSGQVSFNTTTFSNLFSNSGTFFFPLYVFSSFDSTTSHLSIFQTLPTAHELLQKKNSNSHILPCCVIRCRKISSVSYHFIDSNYSSSDEWSFTNMSDHATYLIFIKFHFTVAFIFFFLFVCLGCLFVVLVCGGFCCLFLLLQTTA